MHLLAECSYATVQSLFLQYIIKEDGPSSDDCTVLKTAPMTSRSHRSVLWKLCVCVAFSMTLVLVQYIFLENMYQGIPLCSCSFGSVLWVPLQNGRYVDIHFLTDVTRV